MNDKIRAIMKREEELGFAVTEEYWQRDKEFYGQDERRAGIKIGIDKGVAKGKIEGKIEGKAESVILLMQSKFELSDDIKKMIYKLSNETLESIIIHNQQINNKEELKRLMKNHKFGL